MKNDSAKFFLGANLKDGFVSYFDSLHNLERGYFTYIIKGGPGTGKSGMMRKIEAHFKEKDVPAITIPCSSDPDSLDGVIFPTLNAAVVDGTAPHTIDPVYPACRDTIINLAECWDQKGISAFDDEIITECRVNKALLAKSARFISASAEMQKDTIHTAFEAIDTSKLSRFATRFIARKLPTLSNKTGKEYSGLISGITPKGHVVYDDNFPIFADNALVIEDEYGPASNMLLQSVKASALLHGYNVISLYCPLHPKTKLEHLIILEARLAICTSNSWHRIKLPKMQRIYASRFYNTRMLSEKKERIGFNQKATKELLSEAVRVLKSAKNSHDEIEKYYIKNMNFELVSQYADGIISQISERL